MQQPASTNPHLLVLMPLCDILSLGVGWIYWPTSNKHWQMTGCCIWDEGMKTLWLPSWIVCPGESGLPCCKGAPWRGSYEGARKQVFWNMPVTCEWAEKKILWPQLDLEMKAVLDDSCTAISGGALSQKHAAKSHLETQNTETEDNKCLLF